MIKIAIVGNIASGKSTLEKYIADNGYKVLDTDKISHELLDDNAAVLEAFKGFDITDEGKISRKKLGALIFSNDVMKQKLEEILHPLIKDKIEEFFDNNANEKCVFVSIPLLFEAKMQNLFDKIIFVYADDAVRLSRLIARDGLALEQAKKRLASQQNQDKKVLLSDFVLYNDASVENLYEQFAKIEYQVC